MLNYQPLPTFIVIGAGRSGTTSLYYYLKQHLPKKIHDPVFNLFMRSKNKNLVKPSVDAEIRKQLADIYHDDVVELGKLLNRDLSYWLAAESNDEKNI